MIEYSKVNVKLTDTQLKKLKTAVKNKTETTLRTSLKIFWWKWFTSWFVTDNKTKNKAKNPFNNNMSTDIKLSKAQISKMIKSGGFLVPLLNKLEGSLMKVAVPLAKNILAPLGLTAAASAIDVVIQKKKKKKKIMILE